MHEVRANFFAAELLMPAEEIRAQLRSLGGSGEELDEESLILALSQYFGVSRQAMRVRLTDLAVISSVRGQDTMLFG